MKIRLGLLEVDVETYMTKHFLGHGSKPVAAAALGRIIDRLHFTKVLSANDLRYMLGMELVGDEPVEATVEEAYPIVESEEIVAGDAVIYKVDSGLELAATVLEVLPPSPGSNQPPDMRVVFIGSKRSEAVVEASRITKAQ